jgi:DNA-binding PadR family transcriptional regulator
MSYLTNFKLIDGKQRGILSIYILHSLKKKSKSGYELINEIKDITDGTWIPSKGTLYPLLKNLEQEKLIQLKTIEARGKNIYQITNKGIKILESLIKQKQQIVQKFIQFSKLIVKIIDKDDKDILNMLIKIRIISLEQSRKQSKEVKMILEDCLYDLKQIDIK